MVSSGTSIGCGRIGLVGGSGAGNRLNSSCRTGLVGRCAGDRCYCGGGAVTDCCRRAIANGCSGTGTRAVAYCCCRAIADRCC